MNWEIKTISKKLMTKISHISWGGYDKGFYSNSSLFSVYLFKSLANFFLCLWLDVWEIIITSFSLSVFIGGCSDNIEKIAIFWSSSLSASEV